MGIHDNDHLCAPSEPTSMTGDGKAYLAFLGFYVGNHLYRVGKCFLVPHKVLVSFGILDIEPKDVDGDILLIKPLLYRSDVFTADIVPATLVVGEGVQRGKHGSACEAGVLGEDRSRVRTWENEDVKNARFRDPVCLCAVVGLSDIDEGVACNGIEDCNGALFTMGMHQGDSAIESDGGICKILEHVRVVESIRVRVGCVGTGGGREGHVCSVFRDTVDMGVVGEGDVEREGFGACEIDGMSSRLDACDAVYYPWALNLSKWTKSLPTTRLVARPRTRQRR